MVDFHAWWPWVPVCVRISEVAQNSHDGGPALWATSIRRFCCFHSHHMARYTCFLLLGDPRGHWCVSIGSSHFERKSSLFLPYTHANYVTHRFLSVIIYIHIHEQCWLPLAIWLLLNLIGIILRNWINCALAWKRVSILSVLTRKYWLLYN